MHDDNSLMSVITGPCMGADISPQIYVPTPSHNLPDT